MQRNPWSAQNKPLIGTKVRIDPNISNKYFNVIFEVVDFKVKNVVINADSVVRLRINPEWLLPIEAGNTTTTVQNVPQFVPLHVGTVVRITDPRIKIDPNTLLVVLVDNTHKNNTVKLGYLGGSNRYWPRVSRGVVVVVPLTELAQALTA